MLVYSEARVHRRLFIMILIQTCLWLSNFIFVLKSKLYFMQTFKYIIYFRLLCISNYLVLLHSRTKNTTVGHSKQCDRQYIQNKTKELVFMKN